MLKKGLWWPFVLVFALMILGIQSLGWWTGPAPVPAQVSPTKHDPFKTAAALRHLSCQPKHWRVMVIQQ